MTASDWVGRTFGRWTVTSEAGRNERGLLVWVCRCACGTERTMRTANLATGASVSCGCLKSELKIQSAADVTGETFGRLTVLSRGDRWDCGHVTWLCLCECGNQVRTDLAQLRSGKTKSCGCWRADRAVERWRGYRGHVSKRERVEASVRPGRAPRRADVWDRDGGICHLCGGLVAVGAEWHLDHVIPVSRGGTDEMRNVAVSHPFCNISKHDDISWDSPFFAGAHQAFMEFHGNALKLEDK